MERNYAQRITITTTFVEILYQIKIARTHLDNAALLFARLLIVETDGIAAVPVELEEAQAQGTIAKMEALLILNTVHMDATLTAEVQIVVIHRHLLLLQFKLFTLVSTLQVTHQHRTIESILMDINHHSIALLINIATVQAQVLQRFAILLLPVPVAVPATRLLLVTTAM
jgi:hypothetical protein